MRRFYCIPIDQQRISSRAVTGFAKACPSAGSGHARIHAPARDLALCDPGLKSGAESCRPCGTGFFRLTGCVRERMVKAEARREAALKRAEIIKNIKQPNPPAEAGGKEEPAESGLTKIGEDSLKCGAESCRPCGTGF